MKAIQPSNEYWAMIRQFPLMPIKNKQQLQDAITLMKKLSTPSRLASLTDGERAYLDVLTDLIAKHERAHWKPLASPMTPSEALAYLLEQSGISQSALARKTETRQSHISEFIKGKRSLSKESIVKIAHFFKISAELLLPQLGG